MPEPVRCPAGAAQPRHRDGARGLPDYFRALGNGSRVVAPDARTHPATRGFTESYFEPNDVHSLLDMIVAAGNAPVGILCCEQCGAGREWTAADLSYAQAIAVLIGDVLTGRTDPGI
ncbi:GAF domain-containing protein [Azospirillum thermophilum]|uniref:GAF domain-containing protein n=1 Tax=Azospirillum thermophilum TaxID=2202148 RepID=UPI00143DAA3F